MLQKTFKDLAELDISQHLKSREDSPDIKYLPWAACKWILHEQGAEIVDFWPVPGPDGSALRMSSEVFEDKGGLKNRCYEVLVRIKVDDLEWETRYPVMNGNNPVKDNTMNQLRLHNAIRRGFVKGVAERLGLGFKLWLKVDELPEVVEEDLGKHSLFKCKQRLEELVTEKIKQGLSMDVICDRLGMSEEEFRAIFAEYKKLARIEKAIWEMQP